MLEMDRSYTITRVTIHTCGKFIKTIISIHAYEACFTLEYEISTWFMFELDRLYTITLVSINTCGKFIRLLYQ